MQEQIKLLSPVKRVVRRELKTLLFASVSKALAFFLCNRKFPCRNRPIADETALPLKGALYFGSSRYFFAVRIHPRVCLSCSSFDIPASRSLCA